MHQGQTRCPSMRPAAVPYIHGTSQCLKKVAGKCDIPLLNCLLHLKSSCRYVRRSASKKVATPARIDTRHCFVPCRMGVVYKIPLSCRKCYIRQIGRCLRSQKHLVAVELDTVWPLDQSLPLQLYSSMHTCIQ